MRHRRKSEKKSNKSKVLGFHGLLGDCSDEEVSSTCFTLDESSSFMPLGAHSSAFSLVDDVSSMPSIDLDTSWLTPPFVAVSLVFCESGDISMELPLEEDASAS